MKTIIEKLKKNIQKDKKRIENPEAESHMLWMNDNSQNC